MIDKWAFKPSLTILFSLDKLFIEFFIGHF